MKTYTILNIASIVLFAIAFYNIATADSAYDGYRTYYYAQTAKGKSIEEINKNWDKRINIINNIKMYSIILGTIIPFILSIISVSLKRNFIGIILLVVSSICVLFWILSTGYRYRI